MYAKNLLITFLGFLIALTAYFNSQSGIKEPFLGTFVRGIALPQKVQSNGRGKFSTNIASSSCHKQPFISHPGSMRARENYNVGQNRRGADSRQTRHARQGPPNICCTGSLSIDAFPKNATNSVFSKYKL